MWGFSLSTKQKSKKKNQAALIKMYPTVIFVLVNLCVIQVPLQNQHPCPRASISSFIWTTECEEAVQKQMTRNLLRCILFINGWKTLVYVHSAKRQQSLSHRYWKTAETLLLFSVLYQGCRGAMEVRWLWIFIFLSCFWVSPWVSLLLRCHPEP